MHELETTSWLDHVSKLGCGALIMAPDGRILQSNGKLNAWSGALTGRRFQTILTKGSAIYWETAVTPLLATQGVAHDVALDLTGKAGVIPIVVFATRSGSDTECILVPFHDRARYNRAMIEAEQRAQRHKAEIQLLGELDRLRTDFINSLAHELSTPMTPLTIQIDLVRRLAETHKDPALAKAMRIMRENLERLQHFHRSLVTAADLQANAVGIDLQALRLDQVAAEITDEWQHKRQPERNVQASWTAATVLADRTALASCMEHLLDNALRFSSAGDRIRISNAADGTLVVADDGRGIERGRLLHLGKPFAKAGDEDTMLGAGLGLYIVAGLMKAQGGQFRIHSDGPGLGAEAELQFRVQEPGRRPPRPSRTAQ